MYRLLEDGLLKGEYLYNDEGQRTKKTVYHNDGSIKAITIYHYDPSGQLIGETDEQGNPIKDYLHANGRPVAQIDYDASTTNETIHYLHTDHLDTPRLATDQNQAVTWRWEGEAFGETPAQSFGATVNLMFPGQYYDGETGLFYNWNRYYDPSIGRYITSDPIGLDGGLNTYLYALLNPARFIDRSGLDTTIITVRDFTFGTHSAIHVDHGDDGSPFLYDPAGSYQPPSGTPRGSGDFFEGNDASLQDFVTFHEQNGSTVETTTLPTTPGQEKEIAERAIDIGGTMGGLCTSAASAALGGLCGINESLFPGSLANDAKNAQCE